MKANIAKLRGAAQILLSLAEKRSEPLPETRHWPTGIFGALRHRATVNEVTKKVRDGYYATHLVVMTTLPKSASSVQANSIAEMQKHFHEADLRPGTTLGTWARMCFVTSFEDHYLRPEMLWDIPAGGIIKHPFPPVATAFRFLEFVGSKYTISLRHPASHVVSRFTQDQTVLIKDRLWQDPIYPEKFEPYNHDTSTDDGIRYLLTEGYLFATLSWIANWMYLRDPEMSMVIRYEDLIAAPEAKFNQISKFLFGEALPFDVMQRCMATMGSRPKARKPDQKGNSDQRRRYDHGWSGGKTPYDRYFSHENLQIYREEVGKFLASHPHAHYVTELYPDILLDTVQQASA